jgi:hypothetical protein
MKSFFSRSLVVPASLVIVLALLAGIGDLATGRTSAQTAPREDAALDKVEKDLNHFKCWTAGQAESVNRIAYLQDQFDVGPTLPGQPSSTFETVRVQEPKVFCNASRKIHGANSAGINDVDHHLTCYGIEPLDPFLPRLVDVVNQFGAARLEVLRPLGLCVPTQKLLVNGAKPAIGGDAPRGLDHFKCYEVTVGQPLDEEVQIQDQFDRLFGANHFEDVLVLEPLLVCNPTKKAVFRGFTSPALTSSAGRLEVTPVRNPDAHLVCYRITPPETLAATVVFRNQFGPEQELVALASEMLCVPSLKREVRTAGS